ncbi:N-acetylglucosamine kinase [Streptomyces sp. NBC_00878]|uniref:N-acetylglucosamine kinase n=1 Tax=Streptomyces sp. NBC_00878 TaxID=2975854 RepID=UPI0022535996|nr:BadF/BadG/BcrA/BcrD ATPase family protein [Streptomyces sp. NBC_00878]MCX4910183.1 ATPase [Streptomyces sp. NBC_00878]
MRTVLAVDGGNSKTAVALLTEDGSVLATGRSGGFRPHGEGIGTAVDRIENALGRVPHVDHVSACLAGADFPFEEQALTAEIVRRGYSNDVTVVNDTFALLRAGATTGVGVAVVCGAGLNAVGVAPDGRVARFPALGRISGDWGGGVDLSHEALWHAVRAEDGRGPATTLLDAVCTCFATHTAEEVVLALHTGALPADRLHDLVPPLLRAAAGGDPVAYSVVDRQAAEIAAMGIVALRRLDLIGTPAEVVLGGGVIAAREPLLSALLEERFAERAPLAKLLITEAPPIVGAALLGLDRLAAPDSAARRLRSALAH